MTRKFLFCFPLRMGNIVFGFIVIIICMAVIAYNLFMLGCTFTGQEKFDDNEHKFSNWSHLEEIFGHRRSSLVALVTRLYYTSYVVVASLLMLFAILFLSGVHKVNHCLVSSFFGYSFVHIFLTVLLAVWEATSGGYIQLGLLLSSDVLLLVCLFGVRYMMEAIRTGHVYSQPGEVLYRY